MLLEKARHLAVGLTQEVQVFLVVGGDDGVHSCLPTL
jgi:hypothetical protein